MGKYLLNRILHSLLSLVAVVGIIMLMVYSLMDRNLIFASDGVFQKMHNNNKIIYKYQQWESFGYLDYVNYNDYLTEITANGTINEETRDSAAKLGNTVDKDSKITKQYVEQFTAVYKNLGYTVERINAFTVGGKVADGGQPKLFAYKNISIFTRLFNYFKSIITIDDIDFAQEVIGERGLTFTLYDPVYGGKFSPAIMGNGTLHRYLLYFDSSFPYVHQNIISINLGKSYTINKDIDVFTTMTQTQGGYVKRELTYETGYTELSADDLHTATYAYGSRASSTMFQTRFIDDYTNTQTVKSGMSKTGYSFVIGIISVIMTYLIGVPIGILMARNKNGLFDKIASLYIVFIIAVPSLAYIFMFKAIGAELGLPVTFNIDQINLKMFVLPIVSLSLPQVADLMKWLRRYMIDQMNSDYVKFARASGLTENEIFTGHILKNASIPIIHNVPGMIIFSLTGAIITESVYVVPGAGGLLTKAIRAYDNGVIVGVALFYALLTVVSLILGDILMSIVDPRISFTNKDR